MLDFREKYGVVTEAIKVAVSELEQMVSSDYME